MRVIGSMIKDKEKGYNIILKIITTQETGRIIKEMVLECKLRFQVINIKDILRKILSMVKEN